MADTESRQDVVEKNTQDIIDKVYQDAGLELNFGDGIEKVQVRDDAKPWRHEKR